MSRYSNSRRLVTNEFTSELLKSRGDKQIQFSSIPKMGLINENDYNSLSISYHIWSQGDKLYKLANTYYGDSSLWWIIAWFNKKPIDSLYLLGDTVQIPTPIQNALTIYKRVNNLNI
jgi:hypothetical protein